MKKKLITTLFLSIVVLTGIYIYKFSKNNKKDTISQVLKTEITEKKSKKSITEKQLYSIEREKYEFDMQKNPLTGIIPLEEKRMEFENSLLARNTESFARTTSVYNFRGPSNFGGRTRCVVVDISDATSNTILAGGVSGGVFRTTDAGASWVKVSANDEIHNVTALAQDPRVGFQNIWYYGTGEWSGNSAGLGAFYYGQGIWKSTDSGLTWTQLSGTGSNFTAFDSFFDFINTLEVNPVTGDLFAAITGKIYRYDGTNFTVQIEEPSNGVGWTDVIVTSSGRVYATIEGSSSENGVYTSPTGNGSWTRIAQNGTPASWSSIGRIVLAEAPSNEDIIYALYANGNSGGIEADLWQYDFSTSTWTDYSSKLPDEAGGDLSGNDPFAIQGGYDLVVSVKPDNENFVTIGGTNVYKIEDITVDATFVRIGGYISNLSYSLYNFGGTEHHSDIHALEFDPNNSNVLYSGTDGGVHKTLDINPDDIAWVNLNNNYKTYQYYHVALDQTNGSNAIIGGAQDNGTTVGGTDLGLTDNTTMSRFFGGDGVAVELAVRSDNRGDDFQLYYGSQGGNIRTNYPGFRSLIPAGSSSQFVTYFYLDPDNTTNLFYAGLSDLYRTTDAINVTTVVTATADEWTNLGALSTSQNIRTLAATRGVYNAATSYMLIGGENGGIFRLDDYQNAATAATAVNITPSDASTASGSIVSGLAIHPTNPDIVLAVYANYGIVNIFHTSNATDASPTWTNVERNLSAHSIRSAAIIDVGGEIIYFVGTARGLYTTPATSPSDPTISIDWGLEGGNELGFALISRLVLRPSDNKLLIGTHGNGMFETTVENTLSVNKYNRETNSLTVYPNPTQSELNFVSNKTNFIEPITYFIADITGKVVMKGTIINNRVDVNRLNSGIYFVTINVNGLKEVTKFIKK
ncbi:MAG: T9SS type A sorting domain-containing protein [Flavobacteriaceae bacterium]